MSRRRATTTSASSSGGGGSSHSGGGAGADGISPATPASVLDSRFIGQFSMRLDRLQTTQIARQTNSVGVKRLVTSFKEQGFLVSGALSVIVMGVDKDTMFTQEDALKETGQVLDGNHRVKAAREAFPPDTLIPCRLYRDIEDKHVKKIVADACNIATESFQKRTVFDQVYWYLSYLTDFREGSRSGKSITTKDMKTPYFAAGKNPPSDSTLRKWKIAVEGLSTAGLDALKTLAESVDPYVNQSAVTLAFLSRPAFIQLNPGSPEVQALWLHLVARFQQVHNGKLPREDDLKELESRAKRAWQWMTDLATIIPMEQWSTALKMEVDDQAYNNPRQYTFLKNHFAEISAEIDVLKEGLPSHNHELDEWIINTVRSQQAGRVKKIIMDDPKTRPMYDKFLVTYQQARNEVTKKKLQIAAPVPPGNGKDKGKGRGEGKGKTSGEQDNGSGSGEDDSEEDDAARARTGGKKGGGGGDDPVLCVVCRPPSSSRYQCVDCNVVHLGGGCSNSRLAVEGQTEMDKARRCIDCTTSSGQSSRRSCRPKRGASGAATDKDGSGDGEGISGERPSGAGKKPRKSRAAAPAATPAIPSEADSDLAMKLACRANYTKMHDGSFLSPQAHAMDLSGQLELREPAKLVFMSIAAEKTLMINTMATNNRLGAILSSIAQKTSLHAEGTIVLAVPVPVHVHGQRMHAALTSITREASGEGIAVEDHGLYVEYSSRGGGRLASGTEDYLRGGVGHFMIAHRTNSNASSKAFTCNRKVTVIDISGSGSSVASSHTASAACPGSLMKGVPFPGAGTDFPERVTKFFIQRFTNQGDTVMTCSGERDSVAENALSLGRKVEVFVADMETHGEVSRRVEAAFEQPYREGYLKRDSTASEGMVYIGPGKLPKALPSYTVPIGVQTQVDSVQKADPARPVSEVALEVNRAVTLQMGWTIKGGGGGQDIPLLHATEGVAYADNGCDIPLWGNLIIFRSLKEAQKSVNIEESAHQYVRLVLIADTDQLKGMLDKGKEVLLHEASLYLRVAETCPAYYAVWESTRENTHHEVVNSLPRSVVRSKLLGAWKDGNTTTSVPLKLRVFKAMGRVGEVVMVHQGTSGIIAAQEEEEDLMIEGDKEAASGDKDGASGSGEDEGSAENDAASC